MHQLTKLDLTQEELFACNCCRLYLRALFLSDIVSGDGTEIAETAWIGTRDEYFRATSWPFCPKPSPSKWCIWRSALQKAFCYRGRCLRQVLGHWMLVNPEWPWYTTMEQSSLFQFRHQRWYEHPVLISRRKLSVFQLEGNLYSVQDPLKLFRAGVYYCKSKLICSGSAPTCSQPNTDDPSFEAFLQSSESPWCVQGISSISHWEDVAKAIREGSAIAISDGSFKGGFGTASWTIEDDEGGGLSGSVVCPGLSPDMSAYRNELAGLYSIAFITLQICRFFKITEGALTVGCDGLSALREVFGSKADIDAPSHDLILATRQIILTTPLKWLYTHVKGHQDDLGGELDRWASLNVLVDTRAKNH